MKARICHYQSTVPAVALLVFLIVCICVRPDLIDNPEVLIGIAVGLAGVLFKGK